MSPGLLRLLTDNITLETYTSLDDYGTPHYAAPITVPAFWDRSARLLRDSTGQERMSQHRVFLDGIVTLDLRDKLTLPDGTTAPILRLDSLRDFRGAIDHHEVYC